MTGIARNNIARYIPYNRHTDINIKQNKNTYISVRSNPSISYLIVPKSVTRYDR